MKICSVILSRAKRRPGKADLWEISLWLFLFFAKIFVPFPQSASPCFSLGFVIGYQEKHDSS